jgi:hypothetical protein
MSYPTHDTDWAESAQGNDWRRSDGKVLIVGRSRLDGAFWARADDHLVKGSFPDKSAAKAAAEAELKRQDRLSWYQL